MTAPEPGDRFEVVDGEPIFSLDMISGQVTIDWSGDRPREVVLSTELLEQWVGDRNRMIELIMAQSELITTLRVGRRPNAAMWARVTRLADGLPLRPQNVVPHGQNETHEP